VQDRALQSTADCYDSVERVSRIINCTVACSRLVQGSLSPCANVQIYRRTSALLSVRRPRGRTAGQRTELWSTVVVHGNERLNKNAICGKLPLQNSNIFANKNQRKAAAFVE